MIRRGKVSGPKGRDKVPAMLTDGEYVLPVDTVQAVGEANLDRLREATHNPANTLPEDARHGPRGFK